MRDRKDRDSEEGRETMARWKRGCHKPQGAHPGAPALEGARKGPCRGSMPLRTLESQTSSPKEWERINLSCFWPRGLWQLSWQSKKLPKSSTVDLSSVSNAEDLKHQGRTIAKGTDNKAGQDLRGEDGQVLWWQSCAKKIVSAARR